ncbi:MAG: choice-of-anchor A family protein [Chlamydiales bacterium]|nr:choice-of-anchor A family protein [Chlamydiales bacterium]
MKFKLLVLSTLMYVSSAVAANPDVNTNPWLLNVYSLENIGKANAFYGSDFQGIAGAGGDTFFSGFSLNANNVPSNAPFSLFTGGNVNFNSGSINNGGIEAGGNIFLNSTTTNGNISGGGNLSGGTGQINGNVNISGVKNNSPGLVINGALHQNQAYSPVLNQTTATEYFKSASQFWGGLTPTATTSSQFGLITVQGLTSGRNVVNLSLADINNSYGIALNGPADAFVIFNVADNTVPNSDFMKALSFQFSGGMTLDDIIFNMLNADTLSLQGGTYASLLAPGTNISFSSGLLTGNLTAKNLYGSGQVNVGAYTGYEKDQKNFTPVPEPTTWLILTSMLVLIGILSHRRQKLKQV